jgi:hypothetical protein
LILSHRIHALLHSVRAISNFEDELCTLLHATEHAETLSPDLLQDLQALLTRMPAHDYLDDLDAVRSAVEAPSPRRPPVAKQLSSKARKAVRAQASSARSKAAARPRAREAKS